MASLSTECSLILGYLKLCSRGLSAGREATNNTVPMHRASDCDAWYRLWQLVAHRPMLLGVEWPRMQTTQSSGRLPSSTAISIGAAGPRGARCAVPRYIMYGGWEAVAPHCTIRLSNVHTAVPVRTKDVILFT